MTPRPATILPDAVPVPAWAWLVVALALVGLGLATLDTTAWIGPLAEHAHELFHDARHFVGAPCH